MLFKVWDTENPFATCRTAEADTAYAALQTVRKVCPTANAVKPYGQELEEGEHDRAGD